MKLDIISSQVTGIFKALMNIEHLDLTNVQFIRKPIRVGNMWYASILV